MFEHRHWVYSLPVVLCISLASHYLTCIFTLLAVCVLCIYRLSFCWLERGHSIVNMLQLGSLCVTFFLGGLLFFGPFQQNCVLVLWVNIHCLHCLAHIWKNSTVFDLPLQLGEVGCFTYTISLAPLPYGALVAAWLLSALFIHWMVIVFVKSLWLRRF